MDLENIFPLLIALSAAIGLPLALLARKKGSPKKVEEVYAHLESMGVKVQLQEATSDRELTGRKRSWGKKSESVIRIADRSIDFVSVVSASSQYGTNYYLEYLVKTPGHTGQTKLKTTKMIRKKKPRLWGRVVDLEWRGDPHLSYRLNFDYDLKHKLLQLNRSGLKGGISIIPEPKRRHTRIRTSYQLPSPALFKAIDAIARHVKSWA